MCVRVCVCVCVCIQSVSLDQIFCDPMDCSLLGFSVHGIIQVRLLESVAISFFKDMCMFILMESESFSKPMYPFKLSPAMDESSSSTTSSLVFLLCTDK